MEINKRPYLYEFLTRVSEYYEVYIFTASEKKYAAAVVEFIDPKH